MPVGFGSQDSKGSARARAGPYSQQYEYSGTAMGNKTDNGNLNGTTMDSYVEPKYDGTAADRQDMQEMGRVQELRRNFKFMSVLGFGCTLIGTWNFFLGLISFGLTDGGTAGLIYGFIICLAGFSCVYLSIAEMASMAPTSGGQYHWVSEFAPKNLQKYLSYISGYLVAVGWQGSICSTSFLAGTIIQGMVVLNDPTYSPQPYQGTLLVWAVMVFCVFFNIFLAKRLPFVEGILLIIYIVGFFVVIIPLWVLAPRSPASEVFTTFNNNGGWSGKGVAVMVGLGGVVPSLAGYDCAVHMAEEIKDASRTLPRAIVFGVAVNGTMGLIMVITVCFTLGDTQSILSTATGYPFIQVFFNATGSYAATNTMTALVVTVFTSAVISEIATSSRQLWSFARDGGLPCSSWVAKISPGAKIPLNAIFVSLVIVVLVSLINLGSPVALNAINSVTISALMSSYILTIGCVLYRRLSGQPLPLRRWSLGRLGMAFNIASLVFLLPLFVFAFFPLATPVTPSSMNWGVVMFGGVVLGATIFYAVEGRKTYTPPVALLQREDYEI
ncbi:hypothetical protein LTR56_026368 [Elasticomyces elasticus]|nr:hypothetical protein LTR56_026368 [Elasticomyces elasticus]KAK4903665.1 hypothetical protein LTR49_026737 [Elasticomyces elasticus]KAK5746537.1 hypothetical protein LTS12_022720 [Elasticomyces elasticus]